MNWCRFSDLFDFCLKLYFIPMSLSEERFFSLPQALKPTSLFLSFGKLKNKVCESEDGVASAL